MRRLSFALALLLALAGCAAKNSGPEPVGRSAVEAQIPAAPPPIAPAQPDRIELRSADSVTYMSSPVNPEGLFRDDNHVLNPVDERPAWWAESGLPGTDTQQTVVIVGHNYSKREAPFKALSVVEPGDQVVVGTPGGVLVYTVETVGPLPKGSLLGDNDLRAQVPGRLILANCDVRDGEPTDDNFIVVAQA